MAIIKKFRIKSFKNINTIINKKKVLVENEILDILNLELGKIQ